MSVVIASYLIQSNGDLRKKAEGIALGMTVGSWTDLPATKQETMRDRMGYVVSVIEKEPGTGIIRIAYPTKNFTPDIPAMLVSVFGKVSMDGKIRLVDLEIPEEWARLFPGPKFGIEGIRNQLGVYDRPLLMSISKSSMGFGVDELADHFYEQALGGVDLVKDDEIFFDESLAPLEERVKACIQAAEKASHHTGKKALYAANLTGPVTGLLDKAKSAVQAGANALLFNVLAYGYDVLHRLAADPEIQVPIMAHPALAGAMYPAAEYGIAPHVLLGKLMRLAGADFVLYPSAYGSVAMPRQDSLAIADSLREDSQHVRSFPVPSAGIHPGLVPWLYRDLGNDQVINAGGGVHGHPQGAAAGGRAFMQAIAETLQGVALSKAAEEYEELRIALDLWGNPSEQVEK